jgi:hypothetical protein
LGLIPLSTNAKGIFERLLVNLKGVRLLMRWMQIPSGRNLEDLTSVAVINRSSYVFLILSLIPATKTQGWSDRTLQERNEHTDSTPILVCQIIENIRTKKVSDLFIGIHLLCQNKLAGAKRTIHT